MAVNNHTDLLKVVLHMLDATELKNFIARCNGIGEDYILDNTKLFTLEKINIVLQSQQCTEEFLERIMGIYDCKDLDWEAISRFYYLSDAFRAKYATQLDAVTLSDVEYQIEQNLENVDWEEVCKTLTLSEDFMIKHKRNIAWKIISRTHSLSEDFIRMFKDRLDWLAISKYQVLSEAFIEEFTHYVNWSVISATQNLSEKFIIKYSNKLNWETLEINNKISNALKRKFIHKFKRYSAEEIENYWWYLP